MYHVGRGLFPFAGKAAAALISKECRRADDQPSSKRREGGRGGREGER